MLSNSEAIKMISANDISSWANGISEESLNIIKNKINEIPSEFFEPRISLDESRKQYNFINRIF